MKLALLNQSPQISAYQTALLCWAVQRQLREHFAPAWDMVAMSLTVYKREDEVPPEAFLITMLASASVANALGFHDLTPLGRPYGRVFTDPILSNQGTVSEGSNSVSAVLSHEACETVLDPDVQLWADDGKGTSWAYESADAVENDSYDIVYGSTRVAVSNFVLRPYFSPNPPPGSKFDFMGKLTAPFTMTPGGYSIISKGGVTSQISASSSAAALQRHGLDHPAGRSWKRLHRKH